LTTTTTTNVLIIVSLHKVAGALYISDLKNYGSSQKSVVRQLKQMDLCLPSKRQQRRGGPDLCWQTVPHCDSCIMHVSTAIVLVCRYLCSNIVDDKTVTEMM